MAGLKRVLTVEEMVVPPVVSPPGLPFWEVPWIDPDLYKLLFDMTDNQCVNTYLIVDAGLRKKIIGVFDLDVVPVPVRCLFKGDVEQDLAECAPYLIDLTLHDAEPTSFHKVFFTEHWDKGTGILLRSTASMNEVWSHFRKFTHVRNVSGHQMFFRFWETNTMRDYFDAVAALPERAKDFFCLKSGHWISLIIGHAERLSRTYVVCPDLQVLRGEAFSRDVFQLCVQEEDALYRGVLRFHAKALEQQIADDLGGHSPSKREALVFDFICRMRDYGIMRLDYLKALAEWELQVGGMFETSAPRILEILVGSATEEEKFSELTHLRELEKVM